MLSTRLDKWDAQRDAQRDQEMLAKGIEKGIEQGIQKGIGKGECLVLQRRVSGVSCQSAKVQQAQFLRWFIPNEGKKFG